MDPEAYTPDAPMPEMPPLRTFTITTIDMEGFSHSNTLDAHELDFTTAGGVLFVRLTPEFLDINGASGWTIVKRVVHAFAHYESFVEVFAVPSSLTLH